MIKKSVICTKINTGLLLFTIPSTQYTILYWYLTALKTEQHYIMFLKLMCNYFFCLNVQNPKLIWLKQRLLHIQPLPSWHVETKSTFSKTVFYAQVLKRHQSGVWYYTSERWVLGPNQGISKQSLVLLQVQGWKLCSFVWV